MTETKKERIWVSIIIVAFAYAFAGAIIKELETIDIKFFYLIGDLDG